MNTSAPICISSYIKGGQRPGNKNGNRRTGNNFYQGNNASGMS